MTDREEQSRDFLRKTLREMAQNPDPNKARLSRLMACLLDGWYAFIDEERARRTDPVDVIATFAEYSALNLATLVHSNIQPEAAQEAICGIMSALHDEGHRRLRNMQGTEAATRPGRLH